MIPNFFMRLPIQYALSYPRRLPLAQEHPLDLAAIGTLHFHRADTRRYPLLGLAYQVGRRGGTLPAVMTSGVAYSYPFRSGANTAIINQYSYSYTNMPSELR